MDLACSFSSYLRNRQQAKKVVYIKCQIHLCWKYQNLIQYVWDEEYKNCCFLWLQYDGILQTAFFPTSHNIEKVYPFL